MNTLLDQAQAFQKAGRLEEAEALYRAALEERPSDLKALRPLGIIEVQHQKHAEALSKFERVLSRHPNDHEARYYRGLCLQALGRHEEAVACYDRVLRALPDLFEALNNRGISLQALGRFKEAVASFDRALELKTDLDAVGNRAGALHALGRHSDALAACDRVLSMRPSDTGALLDRGNALHALGRPEDAVASYDKAIALAPDLAEAHNNRGTVLQALGRLDEALASYDRALASRPDFVDAAVSRGALLRALRRDAEALASYDRALAVRPDDVQLQITRAALLHAIGRQAEALTGCEKAVEADPDSVAARWALTMFQIPAMPETEAQRAEGRTAFASKLDELDRWIGSGRLEAAAECVGAQQPFFLAYGEESNRELLRRYGDLCARIMGHWLARRPRPKQQAQSGPRKIRVGIVSPWFYDHSIWSAIVKGWFQKVDRERFSLHVFDVSTANDAETAFARSSADSFEQGNLPWPQWVDAVLKVQPDVLIYPETGMDRTTVKLASMRLAPVQVVTWGHPETSGLPTLDFYLSAQDLEPADAEDNYTERLVRLPNLGCFYSAMRIDVQEPDLASLGIGNDGPLLLFPGVPVKYAPRYDRLVAEIARRLGRCRLVFFTTVTRTLSEMLERRMRAAFSRAGLSFDDCARFLPWQSRKAFYGLLKRADVYIDTLGFSGFNTALQAVECGLPIVTREGAFLRGRLASGILKRLGLGELVARSEEEYVELAVRLAMDAEYRSRVRARMAADRGILFEDEGVVRALESFLAEAVAATGSRDPEPVMIEIVSATRLPQSRFWSEAALALSLRRIMPDAASVELISKLDPSAAIRAHISFENRQPLPEIYNERILAADEDAILVFVHDDIWIEDFFLGQRLIEGLEKWDILGVAGVRRRTPQQTRWSFPGEARGDMNTLSGRVAHGPNPFGDLSYFGPAPAECDLLDGVFLAARRSVLRNAGVLFDPKFDFNFYDLDFCRTASARGLRLGTWPIAITHQSTGVAGESWRRTRDLYLAKWKD